jgi:hypothetical protein
MHILIVAVKDSKFTLVNKEEEKNLSACSFAAIGIRPKKH